MHCPHCGIDINDPVPECTSCQFHIRDLDGVWGELPPFPSRGVLDQCNVLDEATRLRIEARIADLRAATGGDLVLVTVRRSSPRKPSEHAFWLFNRWQVGDGQRRGILVLLAVDERRIESEVGSAWEHLISDAGSAELLERHAVPLLRRGDFNKALYRTVDVLASWVEALR